MVCTAGTCGATSPAGALIGRELQFTGRCFTNSDLCDAYRPPGAIYGFDTNQATFHVHFESDASGVYGVLTGIDLPFSAPWFHPPIPRALMGATTVAGGYTVQQGKGEVPQTHPYGESESLVVDVQINSAPNAPGPTSVVVYFDAHEVPIPAAQGCSFDDANVVEISCNAVYQ
jgi:hypothetical protein